MDVDPDLLAALQFGGGEESSEDEAPPEVASLGAGRSESNTSRPGPESEGVVGERPLGDHVGQQAQAPPGMTKFRLRPPWG